MSTLREAMSLRSFRFQLAVGLVLMVLAAVLGSWAFDTEHPLEFDADRSVIIPQSAHDGDQMLVKWALKRAPRTGCVGEVRRVLVDPDTKVVLAAYDKEVTVAGDAASHGYLNKTFKLPTDMQKKGWISYRSDLCYACNPLQHFITAARICYSTPELMFKLL